VINFRALHVRLMLWHTLLVGAITLIFGAYTYVSMNRYLVSSLDETLLRRARQIATDASGRLGDASDETLINQIEMLYAPQANDRFIRLTRGNGSILYTSGTPKDLSFDPAAVSAVKDSVPTHRSEANVTGHRLYVAAVVVPRPDAGQKLIVEVGQSDNQIQGELSGLVRTLLIGLPIPLLLAAWGAYLLVERSLAPVTRIMNAAEDISLHNLSRRLPVTATGDKLERLTRALNGMIARLDESFQQASRFTADASHELRTPLTIMRGELESILQQEHLPEDLREGIAAVLEETERLAHITEGLLAIARLEAGEAKISQCTFDLGALASATADQMQLLAEEKSISLKVNADEGVFVSGDPARIKQVIVNLLDNAVKYTPAQGAVEMNVRAIGEQAVLEVADTGIGIDEHHLPHIFERFYRADKMRSRALGGTGLGLAIVRSICIAHNGDIRAQSSLNKGSRFSVHLRLDHAARLGEQVAT
jgi:heavy metal sensor kinase